MGLGGVAIAVPPYVIHPQTAVLGRAGGAFFHQLFQRIKRLPIFAPAFSKIGVGTNKP